MLNSLNATRCWTRLLQVGMSLIAGLVLSTDSNRAAQDEVAIAPPASPTASERPAQDSTALKFNFDDQPWPDVLAWFARQAGLSLVINDFPPGGFTFRDSRGYSPTEAIDLLNSVLLTKEFTLVRKDSLLILINTKNGIPYDLVPRKTIEELPSCGRFELVTVAFPLQGRLAEVVQAEVKPLIGPLGKLEPLPATGQVLVTETAGRIVAINALIQAIPLPKAPEKPQPKPEPPPQFLKTYTITDLGLQSTAAFLPAAVGGVRVTVDEPTNQLFIYATEKQHADIDAVLVKLRESARPADLVVQSYRYRSAQPTVLVEQLKSLVPGVLFQVDAVGTRLIAIGNAKQQETLQKALESIEGPADTNLSLKQYPMARSAQTQAMETIQKIVPGVSVTAHSTRPQLLVIATDAQHQQIATVIEQLSEAGVDVGQGDQELATFTLTHADPTSTSQTLTTLLPEVNFTVDTANRRLLAVLSTDQQQRVQQWLSVIDVATDPERELTIEVYSVAPAVQQRLTTLLTSVLPEVKSIYDATSKQLLVTALPVDHQKLAALLETVQATMPEPIELKTYPLAKTAHSTAMAALQQLVPEVKVSADPETEQLIVYATAEDHVRFDAALKQLSEAGLVRPADDQLLQVYSIGIDQRERLDAIKTSLPAEFQGIQFLPSTDPTRLMAWGTPTQHLKLVELLESLQAAPGEQNDRVLAIYPVEQGDPKLMQEVLARLFPTADVDVDADGGRVIVWATHAQHEQIKQAAQQLANAAQGGWENLLKTYVVREVDLALVLKTVTPLVPQLTLSMDSVSNQLIAYGREKDHQKLQELLNQLQTGNKSGSREIKVYEAGDQDPVILSTILSGLVPQAKISTQRGAKGLAIWATVEEHALIQSTLEQMRSLDNEKRQLKILSTKHSGAATAVVFLRGAAPNGVFFPAGDNQSIFAFATEEDLARVSQIMSELERQNSQPSQEVLRTYRFPASVIQAAKPLLTTRVPKAQPMTTVVDDQWMIWATETDHQTIESMLKSLSENLPQDTDFRLQLYNLERVSTTDAQAAIASIVGTVTYLTGSEPRQLRVWTDGVKHSRVQELLDQLEAQLVSTTEPRPLKVLPIDPRTTVELVFQNLDAELIAKASIVQNVERNALLIRATDDVQQQIEMAVAQFLAALPDAPQRTAQSYQLNHLTPTAAVTLLTTLVPAATYAVDTVNNKVAATALAEQHQAIADALQQIDVATEIQVETRAYRVPTGYGAALGTSLAPMYPQAKITWDVSGSALIVVARAAEHAELDRVLREILEGTQDESTTEVYALAIASPVNALAMIKQVYPRSQGTIDLATNSAVITASPREHEGIKELMTKLESAGQGRQVIAYPVRETAPAVAQAAIVQAFPRATVSLDAVRDLLVITASPAEHSLVKELIEALEQGPAKPLLVAKSYSLQHLTAAAALPLLRTLVPAANYAADIENQKLAITGTAEQHAEIAATLQEIDVPREVSVLTRAYRVPTGFAASVATAMTPMFPQVKLSYDSTGSVLIVAARETEHAAIDRLLTEMVEGNDTQNVSKVYRLNVAAPANVLAMVKQIFPRSQGTTDATTGTLIVTASVADHERIEALVQQLEGATSNQVVQAYALRKTSLTATQAAIAKVIPRATITVDLPRRSLIVAASESEQIQIRSIVEQLEASESTNLVTKAYRLQSGDPRSAENALEVLLPTATISADVSARVLWATAAPEDHVMIQTVVDQLEAADLDSARVQTFRINGGDSEELYALLQRMYRNDDSVRLSIQRRSNAILFVGPAKQELAVKQIVEQWSEMGGSQAGREIKVYDLAELDGDVLVESLELLMERQVPAVDLQVQYTTNRLLAVATPEQHEQIVGAMKELQGEARRLEVFTLQINTPETIEDAIRQLFLDLPFSASPSVNSSRENQQLFIRASESQLQQIRELLVKLGEPLVESSGSSGSSGSSATGIRGTGNMRILTSPAAPRLLQQIEALWPQISPNPLRVVSPSEGDKSGASDAFRDENRSGLPLESPDEQPLPTPTPVENENTFTRVPTSLEPLQDRAPVLIFPSANELTVASADQEALAIIEQLFRILNEQEASAGKVEISGNFTIFQLENAGAEEMAQTVGRLFQQVTTGQGRGRATGNTQNRVSIVADERLNSLIVYGSPADRRTIESLIRTLDVSDAARSSVRVNEPRIVKVENVLADKIMGMLESVYRTQLRPDQPPRVQIPAGVSVEVAMALREVNAAAAAPLLTLEVDQATNSIIVLASERLSMEVEALIHRLDLQHKEGNTQGFKVIALEKGNTQRIEESLRRLIRDYSRRRP
jgi:type II secretory pathway component GspD/PulD (secretin)